MSFTISLLAKRVPEMFSRIFRKVLFFPDRDFSIEFERVQSGNQLSNELSARVRNKSYSMVYGNRILEMLEKNYITQMEKFSPFRLLR